jgi:hypothetical protein
LQILSFSFSDFVVLVWRYVGRRLVATLVCCLILVRCLFGSNWHIIFDSVYIQQSMTLASSTLQTRRHRYSEHFKFVIFVGFVTLVSILLLYTINVDVVSLFADSSFLLLVMLNLYLHLMYSINYLNEWIPLFFSKKIKFVSFIVKNNCIIYTTLPGFIIFFIQSIKKW